MSASPESLHLLAHRAGARPRDASDWWGSAIETALAAVAATRHSGAHREQADGALDRLLRWQRASQARPVSADAVALALAARAAATLARRDAELQAAAVAAVDAMAQRTSEVVPELHVALAAWALDELVDDRAAAPWSAVRERASRGNAYGVDAALRAYVSSIAAARFDAGGLVQALITQTPLSPGPNDASIVLWLLEVAIDRCARALSADEPGLRALIDRRATITERLALELDERAFTAPDIGSFDPDAAVDDGADVYLSPMEALLLDIAVAPAAPDEAWLTYPQAEQLFGQHARAAHAQTDKQRRRTAAALLVGAGFAGATLALGLALVAVDASIAISAGLGLTLAWASLAVVHGRPALADRRRADAFGVACVSGGLCAAVNLVNQLLDPPLFSDAAGLIAGALLSAVAALAWAVLHARTQGDGRT